MARSVLGLLIVSFSAAAAEVPDVADGGSPPWPATPPVVEAAAAPTEAAVEPASPAAPPPDVRVAPRLEEANPPPAYRPVANAAQRLEEERGLFLQRPTAAGAAISLRGFSGANVGLRVNGARLNSSVTQSGSPLTALDPFWLSSVTVLPGASPVLYGSDALGGVVELETDAPAFSEDGSLLRAARAALITGTAALGARAHLRASVSLANTAAMVGVTGFSVSDLSGGGRVGMQPYTANEGWNLGAAVRQRLSSSATVEVRYLGAQEDVLVPAYSHPGDVRRLNGQVRHLVQARGELSRVGPFSARLDLVSHRQRADAVRLDVEEDLRTTDGYGSWAFSTRLELRSRPEALLFGVLSVRTGLEASHELPSARFLSAPLSTGEVPQAVPDRERYAASGSDTDGALFLQAVASYGGWRLEGGVRAAFSLLRLGADSRLSVPLAATTVDSFGASAELGLQRELLPWLTAFARGALLHRPPTLEELNRMGSLGWGFQLPTRSLTESSGLSGEAGLSSRAGPLALDLAYAYTRLENAPTLVPVTSGGEAGVGGEPFVEWRNAESATLHSVDAALELRLPADLRLIANAAWVLGEEQLSADAPVTPLSRVPPPNGTFKLAYLPATAWFGEVAVRWGMPQRRLSQVDRLDLAICPDASRCTQSPGFTAVHLRGGWRPSRWVTLTGELLNLSNATYRYHGSAMDEPGLSVRLGVEGAL